MLVSGLLASCSTVDGDVPFGFDTVGPADIPRQTDVAVSARAVPAAAYVIEADDPLLPDAVASAPEARPGGQSEVAEAPVTPAGNDAGVENATAAAPEAVPLPATAAADESVQTAAATQAAATQAAAAQPQPTQFLENPSAAPATASAEPKKRGFLSSFFATQARAATEPQAARPLIQPAKAPQQQVATAATTQLASAQPVPTAPLVQTSSASGETLPGVRQNALFEISRRSGLDDDSDIDLHEGEELYQVASAAGLARLAPNGLLKQTEHVDVACLKPSLLRVLKSVEGHFGRKVVVTSGYRSPDRNRKARGARNSLHMYCAAADIQVEGISKWDLATYVRSMPGRGGVGTYCHTDSIHIDVGPERDWNWRCRRRK